MSQRSRNKHQQNNYQTNLCFLKKYNTENGTSLSASLLSDMAHRFSSWEEKYVLCHEKGYEDFRENVVWLDYDEILEMLIEETVHPSVNPPWQSASNYSFFKNNILPQIDNL